MNIQFQIHTADSAPTQSIPLLARAQQRFGAVPNLQAAMAESPALLEGYQQLYRLGARTTFTAVERQVIYLTISYENACHYCLAAHSWQALTRDKVDSETVAALRAGLPLNEPRLSALRNLARSMTKTRGQLPEHIVTAFFRAGFGREQLLEVVLLLAVKTLSNVTNHIAAVPLDRAFAKHRMRVEASPHVSLYAENELRATS